MFLNKQHPRGPHCRHMDDFIKTGPPMAVQAVAEYLERVHSSRLLVFWTRWNHQNTSCTVEWWDDSFTAVPIEETLLSRSISCAVVYNPRQ